jgi:hypothetical protein
VTKLRTSQHIGSSTLSGSPTVNGFCFWSLLATSVTERASEVFIFSLAHMTIYFTIFYANN